MLDRVMKNEESIMMQWTVRLETGDHSKYWMNLNIKDSRWREWATRLGKKRHFIDMAFGLDEFLLGGSYDFPNCFSFFNRSSFRSTSWKWQKCLIIMAKKDSGAIALPDDFRFCWNISHCLCFWKLEKIKWSYFFSFMPI